MRELATVDPGQTLLDAEYSAIEAELGRNFLTYNLEEAQRTLFRPPSIKEEEVGSMGMLDAQKLESIRRCLKLCLAMLLSGEKTAITFPVWGTRIFTREQIMALEAKGLVFAGIDPDHPNGGVYVNDLFDSDLDLDGDNEDLEERRAVAEQTLEAIYATGVLRGVTGLHPHKPKPGVPANIQGLPRHPVSALTAAVYKDGKWSQTHVLPDGDADWLVAGFDNTSTQYGQACFEGMVAADESLEAPEAPEAPEVELEIEAEFIDGKITIFRPEENARRFIRSCISIGIPPISVSQFMQAVLAAVENNREFVPKNGKLYIRPYVRGLKGGTGVKPAKTYQFGVEVSPFGSYLAEAAEDPEVLPGISVKEVNFNRADSSRGKISGSYSPTFRPKIKALAKKTLTGTSFKDILLVGDDGEYQECASSNIFFVKRTGDANFELRTPSLLKNILPGITRNSLLKLLSDPAIQSRLGATLTVIDSGPVKEESAIASQGAFSTGTAAGITNITTISMRNDTELEYTDKETQKFIKRLSDLLNDARRGKVPGYEDWVMEV